MYGKKHWFFPDAEQPPKGTNAELPGHESIIILNPNSEDAKVEIVLYWTDKTPSEPLKLIVQAGRVKCVRCMQPDGLMGLPVPEGEQYAIAVLSSVPIVAQYGRLDMRTGVEAFYTTPGYCE